MVWHLMYERWLREGKPWCTVFFVFPYSLSRQWIVCMTLFSWTKWCLLEIYVKYTSSPFCYWKILPESFSGNIHLKKMEKFWLHEKSSLQDNASQVNMFIYFYIIISYFKVSYNLTRLYSPSIHHLFSDFTHFFTHPTMHPLLFIRQEEQKHNSENKKPWNLVTK